MHFSPAEEQERFAIQVFYIGRNVVETIYDGIVHEERIAACHIAANSV